MYGFESWTMKTERERIDVFEFWWWRRLLRVPWTARRSNQSILKEISPENIHWKDWCWSWNCNILPPDARNWLIGKDPVSGKDWRQEEKGTTEDEMVGWHHWFNGHEFVQALGDGDGQEGLACCSPWGRKESDMLEQLDWSELMFRMNGYQNVWLHVHFSSALISKHIQSYLKIIAGCNGLMTWRFWMIMARVPEISLKSWFWFFFLTQILDPYLLNYNKSQTWEIW